MGKRELRTIQNPACESDKITVEEIKKAVLKAENNSGEEFYQLLDAYFSKNPNGEEKLARIVDVSRPTIERWRKRITSPSRVVRRLAIDQLKILLNIEIEINEDRFVYARTSKGRKKHIFSKNMLRMALCLRGPASKKKCDSLEACKKCRSEYPIVSRDLAFSLFIG